jgi:predicted nuclease of restriction endonuclease-like (RecB) superfamily
MPKLPKNYSEQRTDAWRLDIDYSKLLADLKSYISSSRVRAALALNKEVIYLYWGIGKQLIEKQRETAWGDKLLEHLSTDLRTAFPEMRGFSKTNLKYMRILAHHYPAIINV